MSVCGQLRGYKLLHIYIWYFFLLSFFFFSFFLFFFFYSQSQHILSCLLTDPLSSGSDRVHLHLVIVGHEWWRFTLEPFPCVVGAVLEEDACRAHWYYNALVLTPEVLVQHTIHNGIKAAVEVGHEVAGHKQPLRDEGNHYLWFDRHRQADEVERRPANGEEHKHHEHGDKVSHVVWRDLGPIVWLDPSPHLDDEYPNAQVAIGDNHDGQNKVKKNHCDSVRWAGRLFKGAGVNSRVILKRTHEQVGHDGHHSQRPDQHHIADRVLVAVQLVVLEAVTDVTVSIDGDAGDVEDGADDADAHEEAADLAVGVTQVPAIVEDGGEDQRVRVDGHHEVCHCQAHHKDVPCRPNTHPRETQGSTHESLTTEAEQTGHPNERDKESVSDCADGEPNYSFRDIFGTAWKRTVTLCCLFLARYHLLSSHLFQ